MTGNFISLNRRHVYPFGRRKVVISEVPPVEFAVFRQLWKGVN